MLWNKRRLLSKGHILILSPIKFRVTRAMRLRVKTLSFYGQNLTWTDFDKILMVNFFFFLPMSQASISEQIYMEVLVVTVRLLVSNHTLIGEVCAEQ